MMKKRSRPDEEEEEEQRKRLRRAITLRQERRLRWVKHGYAWQVSQQAGVALRALRDLMRTHQRMHAEAETVAGIGYADRHGCVLSFEGAAEAGGSMAAQVAETGEAHEPNLEDMVGAVHRMWTEAMRESGESSDEEEEESESE